MFRDRAEAGRRLAERLATYARRDPLVLALPRGGLPVAVPVAEALGAELDVLVVRKLGAPGNPEFAMGAVGEDGIVVIDHDIRRALNVTEDEVQLVAQREATEVDRRVAMYRGGSRRLGLAGRNVIIVDDGLATGSTAIAAVRVARRMGAQHVTMAVPVGAPDTVRTLTAIADDLVCLQTPDPFYAVGQHYSDFRQVSDAAVLSALRSHPRPDPRADSVAGTVDEQVVIPVGGIELPGHLTMPEGALAVIVFVHGTGSSRNSPRNRVVASALQAAGFGTLLFDLLTSDETADGQGISVIEGARRLLAVTTWLRARTDVDGTAIGYFGSSSGAAIALAAAAENPAAVQAVVSRGGRTDLALGWLPRVSAPTLLIAGSRDHAILDLNREAQRLLHCYSLLEVVHGATHLFEERGALQQAAAAARSWYLQHLTVDAGLRTARQAS